MSRRRFILLALTAVLLAGGTYWATMSYCRQQNRQQIEAAREQLRAVFAATEPHVRLAHARACLEIAEPLADQDDPIGATAALFVIGAAPLANATTNMAVPEAQRVEQISTADLLLITQALFDSGRVVPAEQLLDLLLGRQDELRREVLVLASAIRMDLGRDAEVLAYCEELIAIDDSAASPYRMQAAVHRLHGRWDHYVQAVENARARMRQKDPVLQTELIDGYIRIGRYDDAHREFEKLKAEHPELVPRMPTVHARLLIHQGKLKEADHVLTEYLKADPSDAEALVLKGKVQVDSGEFEAAIETLKTALQQDPSSHEAHFQIGQTYARLNQTDLANDHLGLHRKLLDSKVRLYELEQKAAHEPGNVAIRRELAQMYTEIQLPELAAFWERAANAAAARLP